MNLLLLKPQDLLTPTRARIVGPRALALLKTHDLELGVRVRAGVLGAGLGHATVVSMSTDTLELETSFPEVPPPRVPCILIVGLSRPQTIKKVLSAAVTIGIEELHFVRAERGEKSYLSSTVLKPDALVAEVTLGLSQAVDTIAPRIEVHPRFLPFLEDRLPARLSSRNAAGIRKFVADTGSQLRAEVALSAAVSNSVVVMAVGPEAGWSDFELGKFGAQGFQAISLGARMLRVETAATVLMGLALVTSR